MAEILVTKDNKKRRTLLLAGLAAALILFLFPPCKPGPVSPTKPVNDATNILHADPDNLSVVKVTPNRVTVVDKTGKTEDRYLPPEGEATVVTKKDGSTRVTVKDKGVSLSPSLIGAIDSFATPRAGIQVKVLYWGRFGLEGGIFVGHAPVIVPFAGVSWQPDWRFTNTSVEGGVGADQRAFVGLKIRL